jgi:lycopene beta-cyclase
VAKVAHEAVSFFFKKMQRLRRVIFFEKTTLQRKTPRVVTSSDMQQADILIAGAGLAGLTLATQLAQRPEWRTQRIVLLDRDPKTANDRTWCFWATDTEVLDFQSIVHRTWPCIDFLSPQHSARLATGPYRYHMVRGADFYAWAKQVLHAAPNVAWVQANIESIDAATGVVRTDVGDYAGQWVFNSAFAPWAVVPQHPQLFPRSPFSAPPKPATSACLHLLQHFKGWVLRTPHAAFDPTVATLMDFRVEQHDATRFVYVLPLSDREVLVEFTVFSSELLAPDAYTDELRRYVANFLKINDFEIIDEEFGIIPMTDFSFAPQRDGRVIHIGTAGGMVKGSSGYAFKRTQQRMRRFVSEWAATGQPNAQHLRSAYRYRLYDSIFLRALYDGLVPSQVVFSSFFRVLGGEAVFRFLDEKTSFAEDVRAMWSVPTLPFLRAAWRQLPRWRRF